MSYILAFLIGAVAGLRSFTAPAVVSWAVRLGWLRVENTWLAFLGLSATPWILSALAVIELIYDKLPQAPSRKAFVGFSGRILTGALSGAAIGATSQNLVGGTTAGVLGGIAGTFGGYEFRVRRVKAIGGKDLPIALLEDAIAIVAATLVVAQVT
jgi:uncharacterized membrane protein